MTQAMIEVVHPTTGEVREFTPEQHQAERDRLLALWQSSKTQLESAKENEMNLRKLCVAFMHDDSKTGSVENVAIGGGYKAKFKVPVTYGFIKAADGTSVDKARIEKALSKIEKDGEAGELIAERLVKWTPALSVTEYKQLSDKFRKIIDEVVITSEGTPTLEIVEPKAK